MELKTKSRLKLALLGIAFIAFLAVINSILAQSTSENYVIQGNKISVNGTLGNLEIEPHTTTGFQSRKELRFQPPLPLVFNYTIVFHAENVDYKLFKEGFENYTIKASEKTGETCSNLVNDSKECIPTFTIVEKTYQRPIEIEIQGKRYDLQGQTRYDFLNLGTDFTPSLDEKISYIQETSITPFLGSKTIKSDSYVYTGSFEEKDTKPTQFVIIDPWNGIGCNYRLHLTSQENNGTVWTSQVVNASFDASNLNKWDVNDEMYLNNSVATTFNISNPRTANAMVYWITNISASSFTTDLLYHNGTTCGVAETSIRGHDGKVSNVLTYITFSDGTVTNHINNGKGTFVGNARETSGGLYNSRGGNTSNNDGNSAINMSNTDANLGDLARPFACEVSFKPSQNYNSGSGSKMIFGKYDDAMGTSFNLHYNSDEFGTESGQLSARYRNSGGTSFTVSKTMTLDANKWYHALIVVPDDSISSGMKFYLNGTFVGESADLTGQLSTVNPRGLCIGESGQRCNPNQVTQNRNFDGFVDEFRCYNTNISVEESLGRPKPPIITVGQDEANVTSNSCTYSSGTWNVQCSDKCFITSSVNLNNNILHFNGTGTFHVDNNVIINKISRIDTSRGCKVILDDRAKLILGN